MCCIRNPLRLAIPLISFHSPSSKSFPLSTKFPVVLYCLWIYKLHPKLKGTEWDRNLQLMSVSDKCVITPQKLFCFNLLCVYFLSFGFGWKWKLLRSMERRCKCNIHKIHFLVNKSLQICKTAIPRIVLSQNATTQKLKFK